MAQTTLDIKGHSESILLFVTSLAYFDIVLGLPWLRYHNPEIQWSKGILQFKSPICKRHCRDYPLLVTAISQNDANMKRTMPLIHPPRKRLHEVKNHDTHTFEKFAVRKNLDVFAVSIEDIKEALRDKPVVNPLEKLPYIYHDFLQVFSKEEADKLPPHRPNDHRITLKPGSEAPWGPLYGMSREELLVLKKYIKENLEKGFIRPSSSPASSPVLFVKKPGGGLRFCVDYRSLNELTIKNRYPIPRIHETLTLLGKAKYFSKLDVISAFHRMRIAKGDEYLTAFRTRFGLYEYLVMPFGLANAPSSFQNHINDTLRGYLDEFCTAYIDDILIFSNSLEEHHTHVRKVLKRLSDARLQIDIKKCEFHVQSVKFLGLIITTDGIKMDPAKLEAIDKWETPKTTKDVFRFIGFANFYRRFIKGFGSIVMPLTDIMKKDLPFSWGPEQESAFETIKQKFRQDVILQHFDWDKPARLETDASDRGTGGILLQPDKNGNWKPVAFFSRKMSPAESNYEIYDKELLAIVQAFEEWRPELEGSTDPVDVVTDHKALEYFMKSRLLSRRQARWSEFLSRFNFKICYRPGSQNGPADTLSRPASIPDPAIKDFLEQRLLKSHNLSPGMEKLTLLANEFVEPENEIEAPQENSTLDDTYPHNSILERIKISSLSDNSISSVVDALKSNNQIRIRNFTLAECEWKNGILYYRGHIVVPQCEKDKLLTLEIIKSHHDLPVAGHQGAAGTYATISRTFFWHGMLQQVKQFIRNCHICSRIKPSREGSQGLIRPLPIATERWRHLSLDFIVELPLSKDWFGNEFRAVLVVVDRMTKQVHLIPCSDMSSRNTAYLFYKECFRLHGLPNSIVSDRGSQFTSELWRWLCKLLQIDHRLSTAFHPQTDGQTERMNARLEQYLRAYVNFAQDDWVRLLPSAEFAMNNQDSHTTGVSPFLAVYGQHPRSGSELSEPLTGPPVPASVQFQRSDAEEIVTNARKIENFMINNIKLHSAEYEYAANKSRTAARNFKVGDNVWLNLKNVKLLRPCRKLDFKNGGPYKIIQCVGAYAYKLKLPDSMKIHPLFHVSLLHPTVNDPIDGQLPGPTPTVEAQDNDPEYEVERIIGSQWINGELHYLIRWKGYGPKDDWFIPASNANGFKELVKNFHDINPSEPRPEHTPPVSSKKKLPRRSSARIRRG